MLVKVNWSAQTVDFVQDVKENIHPNFYQIRPEYFPQYEDKCFDTVDEIIDTLMNDLDAVAELAIDDDEFCNSHPELEEMDDFDEAILFCTDHKVWLKKYLLIRQDEFILSVYDEDNVEYFEIPLNKKEKGD